jgi:hypothetical protein
MNMDYEPALDGANRPRRRLLPLILLPLIAFILGVAAMAWALTRWDRAAEWLGVAPQVVQQAPQPAVAMQAEPATAIAPASQPAERLVIDPEITRRVNRVEEQLARLDLQSRAAVGNADRAEGLLVAFAARRALDRGVGLGYLEGLLRERFAAVDAQAVGTIITAARQPITLEELQLGFQEIRPTLTGGGPEQSWWTALKSELSGIVTIRREGTPSTMPAERLTRAGRWLEGGKVPAALAEVLRLPARDAAQDWIAKARRYVAARQALDRIETAALLGPRSAQAAQPAAPAAAPPAAPAVR